MEGRYTDLSGVILTLDEGENVIEFASMRPSFVHEGDERSLAIAVINLEFRTVESDELCQWRDLP